MREVVRRWLDGQLGDISEMDLQSYCVQNDGDCSTCSLVNYGKDCHNNKIQQVEEDIEE